MTTPSHPFPEAVTTPSCPPHLRGEGEGVVIPE